MGVRTLATRCLLLLVSASVLVRAVPGPRVVNGRKAVPHEFPSIVSLQVFKYKSRWEHWCGGVLIGADKVLTAAHCLRWRTWQLRVVLGAHNLSDISTAKVVGVAKMIKHPQYSHPEKIYDIAVIKLAERVEQSGTIKFARLPQRQGQTPPISTDCTVAGWGQTSWNTVSDVLMKGKMTVDPEDVSRHRSVLFAYPGGPRLSASCRGDSGGPLYCPAIDGGDPFVAGLVSYGDNHCIEKHSSKGFARVDEFVDWIKAHG